MKALFFSALAAAALLVPGASAADKKIVLVAGRPSHGPGEHEHRAGCLLIKGCLDQIAGLETIVVTNGWPKDESVFNGAAALLFYADGGGGHPAIQEDRLRKIGALMKNGVGLACIHYAVEVPKENGGAEFLDWIGGYFEMHWSVNPHWDAEFNSLPEHPITRGVKPFTIRDEWYYHMRFAEGLKGVTPILTALPPESTLNRPDGPHSGNPAVREAVRKREPQHVAWAFERPDGGRGFGFTGAHFHRNWGDENFRKTVLNALLWVAKLEVPRNGVESAVTPEDLKQNLDPKRR
jgi:type 1 glutamine amidotransferase